MSVFNEHLDKIIKALKEAYDPYPNWGCAFFKLVEEDQARIFLSNSAERMVSPPSQGRFVAACLQPGTNKLILSFRQFPEEGESVAIANLAFFETELHKAPLLIQKWLEREIVPVADEEFSQLTAVN